MLSACAPQPLVYRHSEMTQEAAGMMTRTNAAGCEERIGGRGEREARRGGREKGEYEMHCRVCRVSMNAQAQAKQHYEGRSHARRLKMYVYGHKAAAASSSNPDNTDKQVTPVS